MILADARSVRELQLQLSRCESGTDSIVWMREEKHVRRTCGSRVLRMQFNAPDVEIIRGFLCGGNKRCSAAGMQSVERRLTRENTSNSCREKETSHYGTITGRTTTNSISSVRYMSVTAMLSAVAFILMFLDFSVPFMPAFIKMDLSELPALIGAFSMGPVCGILICLIKNVLHLFITTTGGVGELSNFLLGVAFVLPAGLIYRHKKSRRSALIGSLFGAVIMGVFSVVSNYFLVYPVYYNFMPEEAVLGAYQVIVPSMKSILQCLVCFNMPFTIVKGLFSVVITFLVYKHISPILKGANR